MTEHVIYSDGDVKVTPTQLITIDRSYPLESVTSASYTEHKPTRSWIVIGWLLGMVLIIGSDGLMKLIGIIGTFACSVGLYMQNSTYAVILESGNNEDEVFASPDPHKIASIIHAIEEIIRERG